MNPNLEPKNLKILAIDDNQDNLKVLRAMVADTFSGARFISALNGSEGLEQAMAEDPDVILLVIVMPGMDEFEVCRKLKENERLWPIPVVFLTALQTEQESRIKALETGADAFLSKPIEEVELAAQIRAMAKIKAANQRQQQEKEQLAAMVAARTRELEQELAEHRRDKKDLEQANRKLGMIRSAALNLLEDLKKENAARKKIEESLARNEAELQAIYDSTPIMMCIVNESEQVERINRALAVFVGEGSNEDPARHPGDLMGCVNALDDPKGCGLGALCPMCPFRQAIVETLKTGQPCRQVESPMLLVRGGVRREVTVMVSTSRVRIEGRPRVLVCMEDISAHKQLEEKFLQAQKMEAVGQLAGGVAHDFNNILAATMMNLGLLDNDPNLTEEMRESIKELEQEMERAANLTRQLLLFSRRQVMQIKGVDLNGIVENLMKMLRRLLGEDVCLRFRESAVPACIEADTGMMEQVVMNLCINARDAMLKGGNLTLGLKELEVDEAQARWNTEARPGRFVCLTVEDTGSGMDATTLKRIFEPFFTTKAVGKGTGLGLATVYGIVKQHLGWVEVQSAVGQGTTFRVYLPVTKRASEKAADERSKAQPAGGNETILLVEDDSNVRRTVALFLRRQGYAILEAGNGVEALRLWEQNLGKISLLLSDMVMPEGMTGLDLAERLRAQKPDLRVIITSGYSTDLLGQSGKLSTTITCVPKPFEPPVLARTIRQCLDREGQA